MLRLSVPSDIQDYYEDEEDDEYGVDDVEDGGEYKDDAGYEDGVDAEPDPLNFGVIDVASDGRWLGR